MNGHWLPTAEFVTLSLSLSLWANMIPVSITAQRELIYCSCAAHSVSRVAHTRLDFVYLADTRERRNLFAIQLISVPTQVGVVIWARKWNSDDSILGCIARINKQPDFWRVPLLDVPRFFKNLQLTSRGSILYKMKFWVIFEHSSPKNDLKSKLTKWLHFLFLRPSSKVWILFYKNSMPDSKFSFHKVIFTYTAFNTNKMRI